MNPHEGEGRPVITQEQVKKTYRYFDDFFDDYILHALICLFMSHFVRKGEPVPTVFQLIVFVAVIALSAYSVMRTRLLYKEEVLSAVKEQNLPQTMRDKLLLTFGRKKGVVEFCVFALLYMLLPYRWAFSEFGRLLYFDRLPTLAAKVITLVILAAMRFALSVPALDSAIKYLGGNPPKETKNWERRRKKKLHLLVAFVAYGIGGTALIVTFIGSIPGLGRLLYEVFFKRPIIGILIVLAILAVLFITWGRAIHKRRKFLRRLRRLCERKGGQILYKKHTLRSLFRRRPEANLVFELNGKTYSAELFAVKNKHRTVLFGDEVGFFQHKIQIGFGPKNVFTLMDWRTEFEYKFEGQGVKVLVLTSCPNTVMLESGGRETFGDNGSRCGEYRIFSGGAFLNALDRDCVEHG